MATTRITALHTGKGRSVARALRDVTDYMKNPLKTDDGEFVSSFECAPETADAEFLLDKSRYLSLTGRGQGGRDVIAYHARQSFLPGEVTPEQANAIGYELAMRFTKGRHAFIVCTHTDRAHIHNHIVWNSTSLDCRSKWRNFFRSAYALRRLSDTLCIEQGLSIIENPGLSPGKDYARYMFPEGKPPSFQDRLRVAIDAALEQTPESFEDFLSLMEQAGYIVNAKRRHITFLAPGQKQSSRMDTLRGIYTEAAVRQRITERSDCTSPAGKILSSDTQHSNKPGLLIDIQSKLKYGKGEGYRRWATVFNLKQAAQTLIYLQEHGLDDYSSLKEKTEALTKNHHDISARIKELDEKLTANASLQKHIVNYNKSRDTYVAYRKAGYSKKFKEQHETEILLHQAAKKAFDELGYGMDKKIPSIASLRTEYAAVLDEKKQFYAEYRKSKMEMRTLLTVKQNVDRLLNFPDEIRKREPGQPSL